MKQISDKVFAQVQEALRPFAEDAKYIHKDWSDERMRASLTQNTPLTVRHFRKASEALAALDSAQPVQVNAMLLTAAMDLRHALSNVLQRIPSDEWPKWLAVRDEADKMITAAKQAQPVCGYDDKTGNCTRVNCCKQAQPARPINCGTGHCSCIECPYEQAQPERAPLSEAQVTVLLDSYYASDFGPDELIRKVEQLHGIKQGGQHD